MSRSDYQHERKKPSIEKLKEPNPGEWGKPSVYTYEEMRQKAADFLDWFVMDQAGVARCLNHMDWGNLTPSIFDWWEENINKHK
jgi:hypothetical protein